MSDDKVVSLGAKKKQLSEESHIMSNIFPLLPSPLVTSYRRLISSEENGNKHIDALSFCLRDWQLYCRTPSAPFIRKYDNCFP